jgi:hypothetical protein
MASFAQLDNTNTVVRVISVSNDVCGEPTLLFPDTDAAGRAFIANTLKLEGRWLQVSYNNNFRKQYAGIGYTYDETADVFVTPQPFPSWVLDENYDWQAPIEYPADGNQYAWDEDEQDWVEVPAI